MTLRFVKELVVQYRRRAVPDDILPSKEITDHRQVAAVMRPLVGESPDEQFWAIYLNSVNRIVCVSRIASGGVNGCPVPPHSVIRGAALVNATGVIVAHNHPSGSVSPSPEDRAVTKHLVLACIAAGMRLLDHVVVGDHGAEYSFAANGLIDEYRRQLRQEFPWLHGA